MSVDFSIAWKTGVKILNEIIAPLPNIILGLLILILFLVVASFAKSLARRIALRRLSHQGVALLLARLVFTPASPPSDSDLDLGNCSVISGRGSDQGTGYRHCCHRFCVSEYSSELPCGHSLTVAGALQIG